MNESERIARIVAQLAASVGLDRDSDPRRVLPVIPPVILWRLLPRLLRECAPHMPELQREFSQRMAELIEGTNPGSEVNSGGA